jgi:hypothetical protein
MITTLAFALGALGFGATEAVAAHTQLAPRECDEWNWCAPSQGGDPACDQCCGGAGGFCNSYEETEYQGCICW